MGTRAVINYKGKPVLATHWDGNPESLGQELKDNAKNGTREEILKVAVEHNIDLISPTFAPKGEIKVPTKLIKSGTAEKLKWQKGYKITKFLKPKEFKEEILDKDRGTSETEGNIEYKYSEVVPMSQYGDWAEYEYKFDDKKKIWLYRELEGSYPASIKKVKSFKLLAKGVRFGMGRGMGKGYKNIVRYDPYIHSLSAKGIKTRR